MSDELPLGLEDTVMAFIGAIEGTGKTAQYDAIRLQMIRRLEQDYKDNEQDWPRVGETVKAFVRMGGRLAAASVRREVTWAKARPALKAVQEECLVMLRATARPLGRHCRTADFETP